MALNCILSKRFGIYIDSTLEETSRPFYIGKGKQRRVRGFVDRNEIHERIRAKYGFKRTIIFETDVESEALAKEIELIAQYKTFAHGGDGWWGANLTRGGDGTSGRKWTQEQRDAVSKRRRGSKMPAHFGPQHSENLKCLWLNPTYRKNVLTARKGSYQISKEHKDRLSTLASERWKDLEFRRHMSQPRKCKICGEIGHMAKTCNRPEIRRGALSIWRQSKI